jgi:hypothetical protein
MDSKAFGPVEKEYAGKDLDRHFSKSKVSPCRWV